jgi:hypothetical protein
VRRPRRLTIEMLVVPTAALLSACNAPSRPRPAPVYSPPPPVSQTWVHRAPSQQPPRPSAPPIQHRTIEPPKSAGAAVAQAPSASAPVEPATPVAPASVEAKSTSRAAGVALEPEPALVRTTPFTPIDGRSARSDPVERRIERLLRAAGAAWSDKVPVERRLDLRSAVNLQPSGALEAWREYRRAWLQDDADAAYALLTEAARARIAATIAEWKRRAAREGPAGLTAALREGEGLGHHAARIAALGLKSYGVRAYFDAVWDRDHADGCRVREFLNSWETEAVPGAGAASATVKTTVIGGLTDEPRTAEVRAVREGDGVWRVEPEVR